MNRFSLIDPYTIATDCSPRHVQSVLEDMKLEIELQDMRIQHLNEQIRILNQVLVLEKKVRAWVNS